MDNIPDLYSSEDISRQAQQATFNKTALKLISEILQKLEKIMRGSLYFHPSTPELLEENSKYAHALAILKKLKKYGIVRTIKEITNRYPDEPNGYVFQVTLAGERRVGFGGSGRHMFDRTRALWAATGEAIERWSLEHFYPENEIIESSYADLKKSKLNIFSLTSFSKKLKREDHPKYNLEFDQHTKFKWIPAYSITENKKIYAPLQLFSFKQTASLIKKGGEDSPEPLLVPIISTGAATGQNIEQALVHGILENIERDAFMLHWLYQITPTQIDPDTIPHPDIRRLSQHVERYRFESYLLYLKTDMPGHTVLNVLLDRSGVGPAVCVNAKTSFDLEEAACVALSEGLAVRKLRRQFLEYHSNKKTFDPKKLDHSERLLYWSYTNRIPDIMPFLKGKREHFNTFPIFSERNMNYEERLLALSSFFKKRNMKIVSREIIDPILKKNLGGSITTVMVRIPELQPLHLREVLPAFSKKRLEDFATYLNIPFKETYTTFPHPFP